MQRKKTCSSNLLICRNPSKRLTFEFLTWWTLQEFRDFTCPSHSLRGCLNIWGHGFHPLVGNIWLDTPRKTNMDMFVFSVKFCKNMLNSMIVQGNMRIIFPPTLWIWLWPNYLNSIHWNPSPFWGISSALFWKWIRRNCKKSVVCWKLFSFFGDVKEVFLGYFADPNRSSSWCFLLGLLLCDECCFNGNSCPELLLHWYRVSESVLWRMWTIGRIGVHGVYTCNADVNFRFFRYSAALGYHKSPSICPCLVVIPSLEFRSLRFRNASFLARCQGEGTILQGWQTMSLVTQWCFKLS